MVVGCNQFLGVGIYYYLSLFILTLTREFVQYMTYTPLRFMFPMKKRERERERKKTLVISVS